jgi:hypothetical protein
MSAAEIHHELCATVWGRNIMSEGTVRQWRRMFEDGRKMFTLMSEVVGRPFIVNDDLVQSADQKICESLRFKISELLCEFPQISLPVLYEIMTVSLGYHKFCARWVPKILMSAHKTQRRASTLTFLSHTTMMATNFSITSYE